MLRILFALCAGLFAAMIAYTAIEAAAAFAWPPPASLALHDAAQVAAFVRQLPLAAKLVIVSGWLVAAFVGAGIAARLASGRYEFLVAGAIGALIAAGGLLQAGGVHPAWMTGAGVLLPMPLAFLATVLVRKAWPAPGR